MRRIIATANVPLNGCEAALALAPINKLAAMAANKEYMNIQATGASRRPRLSLHFGGRLKPGAAETERCYPTLPGHELRRIVAAMID